MKIVKAFNLFRTRPEPSVSEPEAVPVRVDFDRLRKSPVLFCDHRSGSNMLKTNLAQMSPLVSNFEVLDSAQDYGKGDDRFNLLRYLKSAEAPSLADLSFHGERISLEYLSRFVSQFDEPPIIDLKYTHSYIFGVSPPFGHPAVLKAVASSGCKIVHLVRRNFIRQAISQLVALKTREFQTSDRYKELAESGRTFWLDLDAVVTLAQGKRSIVEHSKRMLESMKVDHVRVTYEDLTGPKGLSEHKRVLRYIGYFSDAQALHSVTEPQESFRLVYNIEEILDFAHRKHGDLMYGI